MTSKSLIALTLVALAAGCAPDLTSSSLLVRSRPLAAKVTVVTEPTRSNPAPGETADVELFFGDPAEKPARTWFFLVCEPLQTSFGTPICANFPTDPAQWATFPWPGFALETTLQTTRPFAPPRVPFTVPAAGTLMAGTTELLMMGAVCSGGVVDLEGVGQYLADLAAGTARGAPPVCVDGVGEGELITMRLPLLLDGQANVQPSIAALRRDGTLLTEAAPEDAPATGCVSLTTLPVVPVSSPEVQLELEVTPGSAETFTETDPNTGTTQDVVESLQIAYTATAGHMDRTFGFIDPPEMTVRDSVGWDLPAAADVPPDGLLVRFFFTVRDGRGGVDWAERAICVVPDPGG